MPSYKTKKVDEEGKAIYQDICYPVTKEFRDQLFASILDGY
ncbi:MAG: septation protein SpoVG family protein, partial [Lachnospiraceae bacterium]|nr:septation protein SpoVG family protein [Lachnospiraceae bacterium]